MCSHCIADQPGKGERNMSFHSWLRNVRSAFTPGRGQGHHKRRRLLKASMHRPNLEVLEDRLTPSFGAAVSYPVGAYPLDAAVGDFNGDIKPDLVTINA